MRILVWLITLILFCPQAFACSPLLALRGHIDIASESAIIVWDEKTHTEHFVRRAKFNTDQEDFGFLVPTPTQPTLTAVNNGIFDVLDDACRPRNVTKFSTRYVPFSFLLLPLAGFFGGTASTRLNGASAVTILSEGRVGAYEATVIRSGNTNVLARWLKTHGYVSRPAVTDWLRSYVRRNWVITAFKVAQKDEEYGTPTLNAVDMSFHTNKPFYPYSEPRDMASISLEQSPRVLRVFVISTQRMDGALDGSAFIWPGAPVLAGALRNSGSVLGISQSELADALCLPPSMLPPNAWITAFEDHSSPRPGFVDLAFTASPTQAPLLPAPHVHVLPKYVIIWLDPIFIILLIVRYVLKKRRQRALMIGEENLSEDQINQSLTIEPKRVLTTPKIRTYN